MSQVVNMSSSWRQFYFRIFPSLHSLSLSLSLSPSFYLSPTLYLSHSLPLSFCFSLLSLSLYLYLSLINSLDPSLSLSLSLSLQAHLERPVCGVEEGGGELEPRLVEEPVEGEGHHGHQPVVEEPDVRGQVEVVGGSVLTNDLYTALTPLMKDGICNARQ